MKPNYHIFANAALGKGLSGGDRIFIELAKRLRQTNPVTIYVWKEGYEICKSQSLTEGIEFKILNVAPWCKLGFFICYLARIIKAVWNSLFVKLDKDNIIYSASEFWMDSLPAIVLKIRYPKIKWIAAWFQTAPNPVIGFAEGSREKTYRLSALYYWLMQLPIKPLVSRYADLVLVNNEEEKKQFLHLDKKNKIFVLLGAVNLDEVSSYIKKMNKLPKIYDAVFQGRFHPQKGVVELIEIWQMVTKQLPNAKLAMIGDGPLIDEVREKIKEQGLERNVYLFGYVFDGTEKYRIFGQSKLVVHPSFYDSGGMASAEAMAFGIPAVGFELVSFKSYYPRGMVKVKIGDLSKFAQAVVELLSDDNRREKIGKEAQKMIFSNWSWDKRVDSLLKALR